ncbi:hypothetical protein KC343_g5139 [Hortaea werneckii]|uniref:F-box domain-containing protein n=1 Tax=Hortaea werneckii TaxID=91943 RepID=A0A3M7G9F0_HORWE|nr:hypothetical protein KC323_g5050 [Hortaea werneckii]KAI6872033.1 hypothetical protein KC338_g2268 [Hortaea werneckii]KAI7259807.1 hypothetical protein KC352_g10352 [Hortaea werneckii]KAI7353048.1 hypothetical protein KC320_g4190 [Hortaea werneckii]KAI7567769.1 hypothetical protein KC317_g4756 [Hortaea werneckii]
MAPQHGKKYARAKRGTKHSTKRKTSTVQDSIPATQLKQDPTRISLLLDLPLELRDIIYLMLLRERSPLRLSTWRKPLLTTSPLVRINKQVRSEYLNAASLYGNIKTNVRDFNFRHIISFLNRVPEPQIPSFSADHAPKSRTISIYFVFGAKWNEGLPHLRRWYNRLSHPTKRGINTGFGYVLIKPNRCFKNPNALKTHWLRTFLEKSEMSNLREGRSKEELKKIVQALR